MNRCLLLCCVGLIGLLGCKSTEQNEAAGPQNPDAQAEQPPGQLDQRQALAASIIEDSRAYAAALRRANAAKIEAEEIRRGLRRVDRPAARLVWLSEEQRQAETEATRINTRLVFARHELAQMNLPTAFDEHGRPIRDADGRMMSDDQADRWLAEQADAERRRQQTIEDLKAGKVNLR